MAVRGAFDDLLQLHLPGLHAEAVDAGDADRQRIDAVESVIGQRHLLGRHLRCAVMGIRIAGIERRRRMRFVERVAFFAVIGGVAADQQNLADIGPARGFEDVDGAADIDGIGLRRIGKRRIVSDQPGGMNDGVGRVLRADGVEPRRVKNVAANEMRRGGGITKDELRLLGKRLDADGDGRLSLLSQQAADISADKAGASGHQNGLRLRPHSVRHRRLSWLGDADRARSVSSGRSYSRM